MERCRYPLHRQLYKQRCKNPPKDAKMLRRIRIIVYLQCQFVEGVNVWLRGAPALRIGTRLNRNRQSSLKLALRE